MTVPSTVAHRREAESDGAPGLSADALILAAEAALANEEFGTALLLADRAERAGMEADRCAGNRWLVHILNADFESAWRESDAIRLRGAPDPHRFWHGEELRGQRVILRSLHGFGDAVQMFRFLPRLKALAAYLIVEVPPRLLDLARCFDGIDELITWGDGAPAHPPAWDVQIEVMELPYLLRVEPGGLDPTHGYLHLPLAIQSQVAACLGTKREPRVGVVWTAGAWNASRSIPDDVIRRLAKVHGIEFWSLQSRNDRGPDGPLGGQSRDVYECGDGILRLAAMIEQMDLIITVDTLAAHLAGALGVPCWVLLQHRADWRWMCGRTDSPWYPSLRLWRQTAAGDWAELVARMAEALADWARHPCGSVRGC